MCHKAIFLHCVSLQCFCGQTSKVFILLSILLSNPVVFLLIFFVNSIMTVLSEPRHMISNNVAV